eukprot:6731061-Prymnesium_polylepis.1
MQSECSRVLATSITARRIPGKIVAQRLGEPLEALEARRTGVCTGVRPLQRPPDAAAADDGARRPA